MARRRLRAGRLHLTFGLLGMVVVCSLLAAAVGTAIVGVLSRDDTADERESELAVDEQTEALRARVEADPGNATTMLTLANRLANMGELTEAIRWYERALSVAPDDWEGRLDFARTLTNGGKQADAEVQLQRILAARPDSAEAHFYLAELYRSWQPPRSVEAIIEYRRVTGLEPHSHYGERAADELRRLGVPVASPVASPVGPPVSVP